jgi:hypothetical protein
MAPFSLQRVVSLFGRNTGHGCGLLVVRKSEKPGSEMAGENTN